jgi:hypothetical protein
VGVNVAVVSELYSRLNTALSGSLSTVKRVRVGSIEEARKQTDFPVINIQLLGGSEEPDTQNRRRNDNMEIEVTLVCPKLAETLNTLYKESNTTGGLYLFEVMRNVIDKNTAGLVDNTFNGSVEYDKQINYTINEAHDVVEFVLVVRLKTKTYFSGGR